MAGFLLAGDLQKLQHSFQREPQLERTFQLSGRRDIIARMKREVGGQKVRCRVIRRQTDGAIAADQPSATPGAGRTVLDVAPWRDPWRPAATAASGRRRRNSNVGRFIRRIVSFA